MKQYILKTIINITVLLTVIKHNKNKQKGDKKSNQNNVGVFILTNSKHFYISIIAILSFLHFIQNKSKKSHINIINDGSLNSFQEKILSYIPNANVIKGFAPELITSISKHKHLSELISYGWPAKKLLIPLWSSYKKIIIIDSDTITIKRLDEIIKWIESDKTTNLFLQDYMNFVSISPIEAEAMFKTKVKITNLNTGLLCINLKSFLQKNSLDNIDYYFGRITDVIKTRMLRDYYRECELKYFIKNIEQTVFWVCLNNCKSKALSSKYILINQNQKDNPDPVFIHFTPDTIEKLSYYRYLFLSLKKYIYKKLLFKPTDKPWYATYNFQNYLSLLTTKYSLFTKKVNLLKKLKLYIV
ncbi:hypothetical protein ACFL1A_00835 [Patescibacteria group bacterium]